MKSLNASFTLEKSYRFYFLWIFLIAWSKLNMERSGQVQSFTVLRIIRWEMWFSNVTDAKRVSAPTPVHQTV